MITTIIILSIAVAILAATQSIVFIYGVKNFKLKEAKKKCKCANAKPDTPATDINLAQAPQEDVVNNNPKKDELCHKIEDALKRCNGNMKQAANFIKMPYPSFYHYVRKFNIKGVILDGKSEQKLKRINEYINLRKQGAVMLDAAHQVGVKEGTAFKYEVMFKNL